MYVAESTVHLRSFRPLYQMQLLPRGQRESAEEEALIIEHYEEDLFGRQLLNSDGLHPSNYQLSVVSASLQ